MQGYPGLYGKKLFLLQKKIPSLDSGISNLNVATFTVILDSDEQDIFFFAEGSFGQLQKKTMVSIFHLLALASETGARRLRRTDEVSQITAFKKYLVPPIP